MNYEDEEEEEDEDEDEDEGKDEESLKALNALNVLNKSSSDRLLSSNSLKEKVKSCLGASSRIASWIATTVTGTGSGVVVPMLSNTDAGGGSSGSL